MAEARERAAWDRTSCVLCLLAEPQRDVPFTPADFNPYSRQPAATPLTVDIDVVTKVFVDR